MSTQILPKNQAKAKVSTSDNRYPKRTAYEFYPTPAEATRALLSLGDMAPWKGRASAVLVVGDKAVPLNIIALPKGGAFFFDFTSI